MAGFFAELKRRHVYRVGVAYLVVAWVVLQVVETVGEILLLPPWIAQTVLVALAIGWPVVLLLAWLFDLTPQGIRRTNVESDEPTAPSFSGRKLDFAIIVLLVFALGYFIIERQIDREAPDESGGRTSLAVLPFVDMSPAGDQEYFAEGISEEILNSLAPISDLDVTGRTSSFHFKGLNEDLRVIGAALGVEHILEGSLRKVGNEVRITTQLVNAHTGFRLWSENYDRQLEDLFTIQEDIARSVATALSLKLGVGELGRTPGMTDDVAAYDEFLRGTAILVDFNPATIESGLNHLERAIALDPSFSLAWLALSGAYSSALHLVPQRSEEFQRKAGNALDRSRALTPEAPMVKSAVARNHEAQGNWREAGAIYQELDGETGSAPLLHTRIEIANFYRRVGKVQKAIETLEHARTLDPLSAETALHLANAYAESGDIDASFLEFERGLGLEGYEALLAGAGFLVAISTKDRPLIEAWSDRLDVINGTSGGNTLFHDTRDEALATLRALNDNGSSNPFFRIWLAHWADFYDAPELGISILKEIPQEENRSIVASLLWQPGLRSMRPQDGFRQLVTDIGLPDYWQAYGWPDACQPVANDGFNCR